MSTIYKPGTVAVATVRGTHGVRVWRTPYSNWVSERHVSGETAHADDRVTDVRPLVVLDLDEGDTRMLPLLLRRLGDREQSESDSPGRLLVTTDALRKVADQIEAQAKPPRIPEPKALGSRVLAAQVGEVEGSERYWTKFRNRGWIDTLAHIREWDDLDNPVLIRDGIKDES